MHFDTKSYLKSTRNYTAKHAGFPIPYRNRKIENGERNLIEEGESL
jgi:hypothetical protein